MVKDGDLFGDGVNVTARLEGLVKGGEICVLRGVRDHLRHRGGMTFEDLGEQMVKNIAHPVRAFRLRVGDDPSDENIPAPGELPPFDEGLETRESSSAAPGISEPSADSEVALELGLWDSVKDGGHAELEAYLEQYPDGTFASLARTRLEAGTLSSVEPDVPTPGEAAAHALDLAFWESVKDSHRREELEAYLAQYPNGHFAELARARLLFSGDNFSARRQSR
jgi:hypothetical protein